MLVGAVIGAALFGAALLFPEGIAGYLGLAAGTGVITVITNLGPAREHAGHEGEEHRIWSTLRSACTDQRSIG